jgi:hypothetical protein
VTGTALVVWRKHPLNPGKRVRFRTICEVLRELHRDASARKDALSMSRLEECHDMAKRMQRKLETYKYKGWIVSDGEQMKNGDHVARDGKVTKPK